MSITRWYEVCCDNCGAVINHYIHYKPTIKELKKDCGSVVIHNGKVITICDECNKKNKRNLISVVQLGEFIENNKRNNKEDDKEDKGFMKIV